MLTAEERALTRQMGYAEDGRTVREKSGYSEGDRVVMLVPSVGDDLNDEINSTPVSFQPGAHGVVCHADHCRYDPAGFNIQVMLENAVGQCIVVSLDKAEMHKLRAA